MRGPLHPAPQQRGGADQCDYSRKNAREVHEVLPLIARMLSTSYVSAFSSNVHYPVQSQCEPLQPIRSLNLNLIRIVES